MRDLSFHYGVAGKRRLTLRAITGADERTAGRDAQALLRLLSVPGEGRVSGSELDRIPLGDRDRALAALYTELYGDTVATFSTCRACRKKYELRFSMQDLLDSRQPDGTATGTPPSIRFGNRRLRLPTYADLAACGGNSRTSILARLSVEELPSFEGNAGSDGPSVASSGSTEVPLDELDEEELSHAEAALERADPALVLDLRGTCPECEHSNRVPFSVAVFLGAAIAQETRFLTREIHLLASTYTWSLESILALTREERRALTETILSSTPSRSARRVG